jgi:hypothetical protein
MPCHALGSSKLRCAMAARTLSMVVWERRQVAVRLAAATGGGWSAK